MTERSRVRCLTTAAVELVALTRLPEDGIQGQSRQQDVGPSGARECPGGDAEQPRPHNLVAGGRAEAALLLSNGARFPPRPLRQADASAGSCAGFTN